MCARVCVCVRVREALALMLPDLSCLSVGVQSKRAAVEDSSTANKRARAEPRSLSRAYVAAAIARGEVLFEAFGTRGSLIGVESGDVLAAFQKLSEVHRSKVPYMDHVTHSSSWKARPEWMTPETYEVDEAAWALVGRGVTYRRDTYRSERVDAQPYDEDAARKSVIDECYLTLYASATGVGPPIYAITLIVAEGRPYLAVMMASGEEAYTWWKRSKRADISDALLSWSKRAADAGLLLLDSAVRHAIITQDKSGAPRVETVLFDPDFTIQVFDASHESHEDTSRCLLFLNTVLLTARLRCEYPFRNVDQTITNLCARIEDMRGAVESVPMCNLIANARLVRIVQQEEAVLLSNGGTDESAIRYDGRELRQFYEDARSAHASVEEANKRAVAFILELHRYVLMLMDLKKEELFPERADLREQAADYTACQFKWVYGDKSAPMIDQLITFFKTRPAVSDRLPTLTRGATEVPRKARRRGADSTPQPGAQ